MQQNWLQKTDRDKETERQEKEFFLLDFKQLTNTNQIKHLFSKPETHLLHF